MKHFILVATFISISSSYAATSFKQALHLKSAFNPDQPSVLALENFCQDEARKIQAKMKSMASTHGINTADLKVTAKIEKKASSTTGEGFYCTAVIEGAAMKKVKVVKSQERVNNLAAKGYAKADFSAACEGYAQAFAANEGLVWQSETVSFSSAAGNFCDVKSYALVTDTK